MASSVSVSPPFLLFRNSFVLSLPSVSHSFQLPRLSRFHALRTEPEGAWSRAQEPRETSLLRKPLVSGSDDRYASTKADLGDEEEKGYKSNEDEWVDWEDRILEDTVPLVGFVRMILHSGRYESGDRLSPEHEKTILERLLPFHPDAQKKIGCGIDYITIGYHPDFDSSRCLFIVRKDGEMVDFSYWKCIKGLIRKNYPLYADSFILRHFQRRRRGE
ncbi:protein DCL homolog, chloroplastic-like [Aristolochia californica]|uniref:protein DCL homolog, chloroplastic-like n=1 Tax=Aristolochia californica TaxID=171875 RepID=UPI0035E31B57